MNYILITAASIRSWLVAVCAVLALVSTACKRSVPAGNAPSSQQYVCPMHPEIVATGPSICRRCRMKLVPAKAEHESEQQPGVANADMAAVGGASP